jgi:E3 ubiquitin-protein ligase HERC2
MVVAVGGAFLYIDGKAQGNGAGLSAAHLNNTDPFVFGSPPYALQRNAGGFIGEVAGAMFFPYAQSQENFVVIPPAEQKVPSLQRKEFTEAVAEFKALDNDSAWRPERDSKLLELFSEVATRLAQILPRVGAQTRRAPIKLLKICVWDPLVASLVMQVRRSYLILEDIPLRALLARFAALQTLNRLLAEAVRLVDFTRANVRYSLANRLSALRSIVFLEVKLLVWSRILALTGLGRGTAVEINRPRALKARERAEPDLLKTSVGQLYQQLHFLRPASLRVQSGTRPWRVTFAGEGGVDAGGLFRDSLSTVCAELQDIKIGLFVPVPNQRAAVGRNQDMFLPNIACVSSLHLSMYSFVGKLMGMAIRGNFVLNLDLPPLVWKYLIGQPITAKDICDVDAFCGLQNTREESEESKESVRPDVFTGSNSLGIQVELLPNGANIAVTDENYAEYKQLLLEFRVKEFDLQLGAIRKGLSAVAPVQLLSLFTWPELENMVCGKNEIDIEFLKANTKYRGVEEKSEHARFFWEMLTEFSHAQRQLFLRFVWGQSRLPASQAQFTQKFEIMAAANNSDTALPVSHTCFFSLELPRYSSLTIMREKFIYAIHNCRSIDTDHAAENLDWDA